MPVYKDRAKGCYRFEFDRVIPGAGRIRATKLLPRSWTQAQADAFDRQESARLYAEATSIQKSRNTIEDAVAGYLKGRVPHLKHGHEVAAELALIFWAYKGRDLTDLADVCREYTAAASAPQETDDDPRPLKPATIKKRLRYLTAACRWSWKNLDMGTEDPAARVVVPSVNNARQVYIDRAQMLALARACKDRSTRAAIRIAFYSGMRLGEIERASRVTLANGARFFVLEDTKNGDPRVIPVHHRLTTCASVELGTRFQTGYHFRRAREKVGLGHLKFHDLRHSAASAMLNAGVDLHVIGAVLGHRSAQSTQRYAHLSTGKMASAIALIGQKTPHLPKPKEAA